MNLWSIARIVLKLNKGHVGSRPGLWRALLLDKLFYAVQVPLSFLEYLLVHMQARIRSLVGLSGEVAGSRLFDLGLGAAAFGNGSRLQELIVVGVEGLVGKGPDLWTEGGLAAHVC